MNIKLTPDIEKGLSYESERLGKTPEELVLQCLRNRFEPFAREKAIKERKEGETMLEFMRDHIGVFDSGEHIKGGARMGEFASMKFADGVAAMEEHLRKNRIHNDID